MNEIAKEDLSRFDKKEIDSENRLADLTDISDEELNELAREDLPEWVINPKNNED